MIRKRSSSGSPASQQAAEAATEAALKAGEDVAEPIPEKAQSAEIQLGATVTFYDILNPDDFRNSVKNFGYSLVAKDITVGTKGEEVEKQTIYWKHKKVGIMAREKEKGKWVVARTQANAKFLGNMKTTEQKYTENSEIASDQK